MGLASGARSRFFTELTSPASFFSDDSRVQAAKTASSAKDIEQFVACRELHIRVQPSLLDQERG